MSTVEKVKKLLALANDESGNTNERATAALHAAKLIQKYDLTITETLAPARTRFSYGDPDEFRRGMGDLADMLRDVVNQARRGPPIDAEPWVSSKWRSPLEPERDWSTRDTITVSAQFSYEKRVLLYAREQREVLAVVFYPSHVCIEFPANVVVRWRQMPAKMGRHVGELILDNEYAQSGWDTVLKDMLRNPSVFGIESWKVNPPGAVHG